MVVPMLFTLRFALNAALLHIIFGKSAVAFNIVQRWEQEYVFRYCTQHIVIVPDYSNIFQWKLLHELPTI